MTTTVNKPGFSWDDEPNTTISPIKAKPEPNNDGGWGDDEPENAPAPARRQFKTNELPLSSATRTAVEGLSHKFKKKGGFDAIRKQVWGQLEESEFEKELVKKVKAVAISTLESNPSLLSQTTKKSRPLLEGHIERSNVYHDAESHIAALVRAHVESSMEPQIRALRVAEAGEEKARMEQQLGAKTAEEYEEDLKLRRTERREVREIKRQQKEEQQKKEREQREKERKRLDKIEDDKREKERQERKIARDLQRKRQSEELARAHAGEKTPANTIAVDSHERGRYDDRGTRGRGRGSGSRGRGRGSRENSRGRRRPSVIPKVENLTPEDQERYDRLAMDALVRDGKKVQRNRYQAEPEIDETLAPPKRKAMPSSAIKPIDRDPPPVKKELIKIKIKIEDRDTKSDRPPSRFDIKLNDLDRRDKPRERSRDRGYPRRGSVDRGGRGRGSTDRGGRSRRSSRDRLDRIDRRRSRSGEDRRRAYDDRDRDPPRRSARDSKDFRDSVIRTQRERYARPRSPVRDRDTHTRRRSRSPLRSPLRKPSESLARSASITDTKPILPIDLARDPVLGIKHGEPTGRKYIDYEAEERKYIETKKREVEAAKFTQLRKEAKEKGLPMPGYDQREIYDRARESRDSMERHGSGTPGLGRGDSRGGRPEWKQSAPNGGFATPVARDNSGGAGLGRGRSIGRPPSRDGLVFRSRENTPAPVVGGPKRESATRNQNRSLTDIALEARDRRSATPATANVKTESNVRAATPQIKQENNVKTEQPSPALTRQSRRDSTEAGEIVAGVPEGAPVSRFDGGSVRRKSRSRSRDRRDRRDEKPRADSRERRRRDERDDRRDIRDDRRNSRRDDTRDRRDDRDRRPRSRSRDRDRRYRSRSGDSRRPRDSGRSFGGRR